MNRWLDLAWKLTSQSQAKQQRMAAIVVRGGAVLSVGINHRFNHCERRALRPHHDYSGATIYIARHNKLLSRPCDDCQKLLIYAGIRQAVYNSSCGNVVTERYGKG